MTDLRSKFEGIPEIKVHLDHGNVFFNVEKNTYASEFSSLHVVSCYVNGAWFVFQEQRKKIDTVIKWVEENMKSIPLSEWHGYTSEQYVDADDLLEILK